MYPRRYKTQLPTSGDLFEVVIIFFPVLTYYDTILVFSWFQSVVFRLLIVPSDMV